MARNKEFDELEVLKKAMELFWEQGYEKTSMQDLVDRMGIHRRSLYDTFGDKHALFMRALGQYGLRTGSAFGAAAGASASAADGIRAIFNFTIAAAGEAPKGCLFVNTAVELALRDQEADEAACKGFDRTEQLLAELIRKGQENGEFSRTVDAGLAAENLHNALVGLRVLARTRTDREKLRRIAEAAIAGVVEK